MSRSDPISGFTLLEVLAAVAVLGILFTVLSNVAIEGLRHEGESKRRIDASLIADRAMIDLETEFGSGIVPPTGRTEFMEGDFRIVVEVTDSGPGIEDVDKALEPGFSTAPQWVRDLGFGAVMGLSNIRNCADDMSIESQPGEGTRLTITFFMEGEGEAG